MNTKTAKNGWEQLPDSEMWRYTKDIPEDCRVELITDGKKWRFHIDWHGKGYRGKRWASLLTAKRNAVKLVAFLENHDNWQATK